MDLSTTYSGVVILPQSCNQAAMCMASWSSALMLKSAKGPSRSAQAASANSLASSGTRAQWPPV
ncbi:hypothetical protein D9M69_457440 [compost metagenome]